MALAAAPMYFYKRGKGRYRKRAARSAQGRARLGRAQEARRRADRGVGDELSREPAARRVAREAADAALQAGQERARMEGARRGMRGGADESGWRCSRHAAPFRRRTTTTSTRSSRRRFRKGAAFAAYGALPPVARAAASRDGARVFDRRRDDDRDRRRVLGARASRTATTRSASTSPRPALGIPRGSPLDAHRARALVDGLHARAASSRCCPRRSVAAFTLARGALPGRALSLLCGSRRRKARSSGTRRASIACRSPPTCGSTRSAMRLPTSCRRPAIRRGRRSCARCGSSRSTCRRCAGKADFARIDYSFDVDWDRASRTASGRVRIVPRRARSPLDKLDLRADDPRQQQLGQAARRRRRVAGLYRTQVERARSR